MKRMFKIGGLLLMAVSAIWLILPRWLRSATFKPFVVGHRGARGLAPENTMAAIREGLRQGSRFIEVDIHRSADGELVVIHDRTLERTTTGHGLVREQSMAALQAVDAGSKFAPHFAGESIPSLRAVLAAVQAAEATLVIEVKHPTLYPGIATDLAAMLHQQKMENQVVVISFDHAWLAEFSRVAPKVLTGTLWSTIPWWGVPATGVVDVDWRQPLYEPTLVWRMNRQGNQVWVYTVNNPWLMRWLMWVGVEGITTDRPDIGAAVVGHHPSNR